MARFFPLALVVAVAAMGLPLCFVGFLSDDWAIIEHLTLRGNASAWAGSWLDLRSMLFHRPVFTGLYALELELFGANPLLAHLHHLAWHLAAVLLLYAFVRQLGGRAEGAFAGALLFAWHPFVAAAVGWMAGRCGVVSGVFTLLTLCCWLRHRRGGSLVWVAVSLLGAVGAVLTRESGYLALIAPLTLDLLVDRPPLRRLVRSHLAFAVSGVGLLVLRFIALGTVKGGYPEADGLIGGEGAARRAFDELVLGFEKLVKTLPKDFVPEGCEWMQLAAAGLAVFGVLMALIFRFRAGVALLLLIATQGALLLATGPAFAPSTGQRWYTLIALFCALLGLGARRWAVVPLLLLAVLHGIGFHRVGSELRAADEKVQRLLDEVATQLKEAPSEVDRVFLSGLPMDVKGMPLTQWGVNAALHPPFRESSPLLVYPVHGFMDLGAARWALHPPVEAMSFKAGGKPLVLRVSEGDGKYGLTRYTPQALAASLPPDLGTLIPRGPLKVTAPQEGRTLSPQWPLKIPLLIEAPGLEEVEIFAFLPTIDWRLRRPLEAGRLELDLGPALGDYLLFSEKAMTLSLVVVGHGKKGPYLGELVEYRIEGFDR